MHKEQLTTIALFWIRRIFSSRHGVLFIVVFALYHAMVALWAATLADNLDALTPTTEGHDVVYGMLSRGVGLELDTVKSVLSEHPPVLVALFALAILSLPWLTILASFDQTASDISTRHLRFVLVRTNRLTLYVGHALGALGFVALAQAVGLLVLSLVLLSKGHMTDAASFLYVGRVWLCLVLYSVPFIAVTACISVITARPMWSLACTLAFWFGVVFLSFVGGLIDESFSNLSYIFPTAFNAHFVSDYLADVGTVVSHTLALSTLYFGAGYLWLRSRAV